MKFGFDENLIQVKEKNLRNSDIQYNEYLIEIGFAGSTSMWTSPFRLSLKKDLNIPLWFMSFRVQNSNYNAFGIWKPDLKDLIFSTIDTWTWHEKDIKLLIINQ